MPALAELAGYLDTTLRISSIPDYANAVNGVQLENLGDIHRIATAVDFSTETALGAINAGARLMIVHHGMLWSGAQPITGHRHQRLWALSTQHVAVSAA